MTPEPHVPTPTAHLPVHVIVERVLIAVAIVGIVAVVVVGLV